MRKTVVMIGLLAATMMTYASDIEQNVGLQFGFDRHLYRMNAPTRAEEDKTKLYKEPLNGGKFGFVYDVTFYKGLGLFLGFNYSYTMHSSRWKKIPYSESGKPASFEGVMLDYRYKAEEHMLDWNVLLQYKFEIAGGTYLGFYTGPSVQYIAKYQSRDYFRKSDGTEIVPDIRILEFAFNKEDVAPYYKNYNVTWGLGAMFQYDCYFIRGGYDFGLVNPYNVAQFGEVTVENAKGVPYPIFTDTDGVSPDSRTTRGRLDSWFISLGVFIWQSDK